MGKSEYRANWRGVRRNVSPWRRLKHGDPVKLKVLAEDIWPRRFGGPSVPALLVAAMLVSAVGIGYTADELSWSALKPLVPGSGCMIKGNFSYTTGERIYHVPGQPYYSRTIITLAYGERWFCSELEARHAGWRKARN
ncbi:hypothetical protein [Mesorhizobium sp. CAU 1741]|uniref:sunset domain-containing protein n=1 Tax=Mesorhizobium sp. CAU 1741 TaxID=3140366 RepID=UPI00325AB7D9